MRKINSIKQLLREKKRIKEHRDQLENRIYSGWKEMKESVKPFNLVKDIFSHSTSRKNSASLNTETVLKTTFKYAAIFLATGFIYQAIGKLKRFFRK